MWCEILKESKTSKKLFKKSCKHLKGQVILKQDEPFRGQLHQKE